MLRVLTSKINPNYRYVKQPTDRAPSRSRLPKPLEVRLANSAREVGLIPPAVTEICPPKFPPWAGPNISICPINDNKKISSDAQLKASFLDHYSKHNASYSIYTDGSKSPVGVGCSVVSQDAIIKKKLPSNSSVFTAEQLAVLSALKYIFFSNFTGKSFSIFMDSMSELNSIGKLFSCHSVVQEIHDWIYLLVN